MNEAKQIHDELLNARLSIIPRTAYQDIRRLTHTVRLGAWAEVLEGRAKSAASRGLPSDGHVCHHQHPVNAHTLHGVPALPAKDHRLELPFPLPDRHHPPLDTSPVSHR